MLPRVDRGSLGRGPNVNVSIEACACSRHDARGAFHLHESCAKAYDGNRDDYANDFPAGTAARVLSLRQPSADAHILMVKRRRCHSFPFAAGVSALLSATLTQSRELVKAAKGLK